MLPWKSWTNHKSPMLPKRSHKSKRKTLVPSLPGVFGVDIWPSRSCYNWWHSPFKRPPYIRAEFPLIQTMYLLSVTSATLKQSHSCLSLIILPERPHLYAHWLWTISDECHSLITHPRNACVALRPQQGSSMVHCPDAIFPRFLR